MMPQVVSPEGEAPSQLWGIPATTETTEPTGGSGDVSPAQSLRTTRGLGQFRLYRTLLHGLVGFGFGFFVLHPVAMMVFAWFGAHPTSVEGLWREALRSFAPQMFPMGFVFGLFSAAIAMTDGFYRSTVRFQRDNLKDLVVRLEAQNELLQELETAKRRATRFMVHDLKNHVGCVVGFAGLLKKESQLWKAEERDAIEMIERQSRRMMGTVSDILDLARLEKVPSLAIAAVTPTALIQAALTDASLPNDVAQAKLGSRHVNCSSIMCDRNLVLRVLVNLVLNAAKHNPGGVEITLDAEPASNTAIFSCQDSGNGIPEDLLPGLFNEYTTSDRASAGRSHGLGLAFCKAAVEAHGGRIWCQSQAGHGTTFFFTLGKTVVQHTGHQEQST